MANSVDPDQTAPLAVWRGAVWSGSTLFAQPYLSKNLEEHYSTYQDHILHMPQFCVYIVLLLTTGWPYIYLGHPTSRTLHNV